jgi:GAF domain-containing protein
MSNYLSVLCEVCNVVSSSLDPQKVLSLVVKNAAEAMGAKASSLRLLDERMKTLKISAAWGLSEEYLKKGPVEVKKSLIDKEALSGKAVAILNAAEDRRFQYPEEAKKEGIASVLCVPLRTKDKAIGVLRVYTSTPRKFTDEDVTILSTLASQSAIAIENAQLYQQMQTLYDIAKMVSSSLNLQEVLDLIVQSAAKIMKVKASNIRLLDEERKRLELRAAYGLSRQYLEKGPVEADRSIAETLKGKPVTVFDVTKDPRVQYPEAAKREGICSILSVPLAVKDVVIGVLRVYTSIPHRFTQNEIEFLSALADQGAIAIENARLYEHVKKDYEDLTKDVWKWYDWGARPPKL